MPRPPYIIDRVNYVVKFIQDPCDAPFIVYVETALPAAKNLLLAWFDFGIDDVVRGYFRPAGLRGAGHLGRRRRKDKLPNRRGRVSFLKQLLEDDLGNIVGKHLPGARLVKARQFSQAYRCLWIIDGVIQRLLWWYLVIDLSSQFLYEWTSLLMKTEYCQNQRNFCFIGTDNEDIVGPQSRVLRNAKTVIEKRRGDVELRTSPSRWHLPGPGLICLSARHKPDLIYRGTGYYEIVHVDSGRVVGRSDPTTTRPGTYDHVAAAEVPAGDYQIWLVNDSSEYARFTDVHLTIIGIDPAQALPD